MSGLTCWNLGALHQVLGDLDQELVLLVSLQYCLRQTLSLFHIYNNSDFQIAEPTTATKIVNATMSEEIRAQTVLARILSLSNCGQRRSERTRTARGDSNSNIYAVEHFSQHDAPGEKDVEKALDSSMSGTWPTPSFKEQSSEHLRRRNVFVSALDAATSNSSSDFESESESTCSSLQAILADRSKIGKGHILEETRRKGIWLLRGDQLN